MRGFPGDQDENGTGARETAKTQWERVEGRFWGRLWDLDCVLELHLDEAGRVRGSFDADGEVLEVTGGPPSPSGEIRGLVRARVLGETFAVFRARPDEDGLLLEMEVTDAEGDPTNTAHVMFARLE